MLTRLAKHVTQGTKKKSESLRTVVPGHAEKKWSKPQDVVGYQNGLCTGRFCSFREKVGRYYSSTQLVCEKSGSRPTPPFLAPRPSVVSVVKAAHCPPTTTIPSGSHPYLSYVDRRCPHCPLSPGDETHTFLSCPVLQPHFLTHFTSLDSLLCAHGLHDHLHTLTPRQRLSLILSSDPFPLLSGKPRTSWMRHITPLSVAVHPLHRLPFVTSLPLLNRPTFHLFRHLSLGLYILSEPSLLLMMFLFGHTVEIRRLEDPSIFLSFV